MFYSKTTGSFYTTAIHGNNMPADVVAISQSTHAALMQGQSEGKAIVPAPDGSAMLEDPPKATAAEMWERIKAKRDHLSDTGGYKVIVAGVDKWFHSDAKSKGQQMGLVLAGAAAARVPPWKTMDGTKVSMSQTLAQEIFQSAMLMEGEIFQAAETHKADMEASADPSAYDFSGGWPATFQA